MQKTNLKANKDRIFEELETQIMDAVSGNNKNFNFNPSREMREWLKKIHVLQNAFK